MPQNIRERKTVRKEKLNIRDDRCNHFTPQRLGYRTRAVMKRKSGTHFQKETPKERVKEKTLIWPIAKVHQLI